MPVQYQTIPQFQMPEMNLLGAYAQGQALQQNRLQQERLAQQMDLAERAAGYTAAKESRQASEAEMNARVKLQELKSNVLKHAQMQLQSVPPGDDAGYQAVIGQYKDILPDEYAIASKYKWNDDTRRMMLLPAEQQYGQTVVEANVPGGKERRAYPTFNPLAGEKVIPGSFAPTQEKWKPVLNKGTIEYYTNETGTKTLTPDEYKAMTMAQPAPPRGQAGAFEPPAVAPPALTPPAAEPMNLVNQARIGVSKVETGGDYGAIGPDVKRKDGTVDNAYGKYQVMGANIPSWTKQALGRSLTPQEFLADKDAQEAVFEDQFKRNIAKYGSLEDAVSVWFSGRPLAQATKAGARDVNMGVGDYVNKVMAGSVGPYQTAKTAPLTGERPSLRALTEQPTNAMAPMLPPANAMAAPQPAPQVDVSAGLTQPRPQATTQPSAPVQDAATRQQQFIANAPLGQRTKYESKVELENMLTNLSNEIEYLTEQGGVPSVKNPAAKNVEIASGASWLGQAYGQLTGSPIQSTRDTVNSIRQNLVSVLARATGKTAQELNSNFDVKNAIKALGDPKATVESVRATLNNLNKTFGTKVDISGSSAKSETRRQIEAAKAAPAETAGVPAEAIQMLKQDPSTAAAFDEHFGVPGLAAKILGR